jgi:hypothetical protein
MRFFTLSVGVLHMGNGFYWCYWWYLCNTEMDMQSVSFNANDIETVSVRIYGICPLTEQN